MLEKTHVEKSAVEDVSLPTQEDYDAVVRSVKDYAEGWYDGDPERMRRCLHPDLTKRTIEPGSEPGTWKLRRPITFDRMVDATKQGGGSEVPKPQRRYQIDVLDLFRHIAIARCVSPQYVDYLHLAKFGDRRWLIVDALWELRKGALDAGP
jgi:Putative lumazine-binding